MNTFQDKIVQLAINLAPIADDLEKIAKRWLVSKEIDLIDYVHKHGINKKINYLAIAVAMYISMDPLREKPDFLDMLEVFVTDLESAQTVKDAKLIRSLFENTEQIAATFKMTRTRKSDDA